MQCAREAFTATKGPEVKTVYLTESGRSRIDQAGLDISRAEVILVSEPVMAAMSSTITPQGIISICSVDDNDFSKLKPSGKSRYIYLHEIQDPGNAGTILRTADAMGIDAVIVSPGSVDMYSPKVVRATAGSLWHVPLFTGITLAQLNDQIPNVAKIALSAQGHKSLLDVKELPDVVAIFGNEARGIDALIGSDVMQVSIPMTGNAESLNLAAAAAIVIFHLSHN